MKINKKAVDWASPTMLVAIMLAIILAITFFFLLRSRFEGLGP